MLTNTATNALLARLNQAFWQAQADCLAAYEAGDSERLLQAVNRKHAILAQQRAVRVARVARLKSMSAPIQPSRCIPVL